MLSLLRLVEYARSRGCKRIGIAFARAAPLALLGGLPGLGIAALVDCGGSLRGRSGRWLGAGVFTPAEAAQAGIDAAIVVDGGNFAQIMRHVEPLSRSGALILPLEADWVVPARVRSMSALEAAWQTSDDANYVSRSGLKGHYLEFGTFWGRSFFPAYFRFHRWLEGKFFAFDSFEGLSAPMREETAYTGGDFTQGAYCANARSFESLGELLGVDKERLRVVPGFYEATLLGKDPADYGLAPASVSVCAIDCDLREPTRQVLDFVLPLLEPGALLYFDDWRLCRASPSVGERSAALDWLLRNRDIELIELHRSFWQHQWFIFQRRSI